MKRKGLVWFAALLTCVLSSGLVWAGNGALSGGDCGNIGAPLTTSDERLKKNIEPLKSSLEKIMKLQGVTYMYKDPRQSARGITGGKEIGLIAQKVETVLPEIVSIDAKGYKALAYDRVVAVLIEAIKEQQSMISKMDEVNKEQNRLITEKEMRIERLEDENVLIMKALEELSNRVAVAERGSAAPGSY